MIAIIAVLAAIVVVNVNGYVAKARDARRVADLRSIRTALELYFADHGFYPPASNFTDITSPASYDDAAGTYGDHSFIATEWQHNANNTALGDYLKPYLSVMPVDPINSNANPFDTDGHYSYLYANIGRYTYVPQYDLIAQLEVKNNPLTCQYNCYKFYFNIGTPGISWCTGCGTGAYSKYIYEASAQ